MRKLFYLMVLIVILGLFISGCILPVVPLSGQDELINIAKDASPYETNLIAGQHTIAGYITVSNDDETLFIAYETVDNWLINETHLYVGTTIPTKSAPGEFPYKHEELGGVTTDTYEIPLEDLGVAPCDIIYIAAHADLVKGETEETGWAEGVKIRPDKNWAMYFEYRLSCDVVQEVLYIHKLAEQKLNDIVEGPGIDIENILNILSQYLEGQVGIDSIIVDGNLLQINYDSGLISFILLQDPTVIPTLGGNVGETTSSITFIKQKRGIDATISIEYTGNRKIFIWVPIQRWVGNYNFYVVPEFLKRFNESNLSFSVFFLENEEADVESLKTITDYGGMVIFNTHGCKGDWLCTGELFTIVSLIYYFSDLLSGNMAIWNDMLIKEKGGVESYHKALAVNSNWFKSNLSGNFLSTIILNMSCESLKTDALWNVFRDKGAGAYFGFTDIVTEKFETEQGYNLVEKLREGDLTTGEAYERKTDPYGTHNAIWVMKGKENLKFPKDMVSNVVAISWTDHIPENSQNIEHLINVFWDPYPEASGYKVYRSVNGVVEAEPVYSGPGEPIYDKDVVQWHDTDIVVGNTYSYYVTAYGDGWETSPSQESGSINAFLPPIYLVSPSDGETINNPTPVFKWSPVGPNPEGCKNFGTTELWVIDLTSNKELVWQIVFDDMTTFSATYNQDGQASLLIPGHSYGWQVTSYGYSENMEDAISQSEYWEFTYSTATGSVHNLNKNTYYNTIQAALDDADNNNTIEVSDGTYTENVDVNKRLTIKSENGSANCIVQAANSDDHVFEVTADYVNINGFTVKGATGYYKAGIYLKNSNNCNISSNICKENVYEQGIYLYSSSNNTITDNICSNNGEGIRLSYSGSNTITNNTCSENYYSGIVLTLYSNNNTIADNSCLNNLEGIGLWHSSNIIVKGNTFEGCGIEIHGDAIDHFATHIIESNAVNGKPIYYYKNNDGITVPEDAGQVIIANCSDITIRGINASSTSYGIELAYTSNSIIENNIANKNNIGIYLTCSSNNIIRNNICSNNHSGGIYLWGFNTHNTIANNNCTDNLYGMGLTSSSSNKIINNDFDSCDQGGIGLDSSNNNIIMNNSFSNIWFRGIWLSSSNNNKIYLNNFKNNVDSKDSTNTWNSPEEKTYTYNDDTYTNYLGNYWSNYTGNDADGDGIGDTPYKVDGDHDDYPLMSPFENYY